MTQPATPDRERLHLSLMLALTFSTGLIDAVGYLGLDRVFTGNMTGNIVILGMGVAGADDLPVVGPLIALGAFVAGAAGAGALLRGARRGWGPRVTTVLGGVSGMLAVSAFPAALAAPQSISSPGLVATGLLGAAMGAQAGAARHIAVADVTTVVVTSTLVAFAFDSKLAGGSGERWVRRGSAVLVIAAGALVGALLVSANIAWGIALAAGITAVVATLGAVTRGQRG
jgi:uncharacterized membrane protein YoaK (UPF0700 family)